MSLSIQKNISLKPYNTLAVDVQAEFFAELTEAKQLPELLAYAGTHHLPVTVLGGGSNVVFTDTVAGLVIHVRTQGIAVHQDNDYAQVNIQAGENWHQLVMSLTAQGYGGLENLALIPGTAGAAAVQNIGAYGVELETVFESVTGWDITNKQWQTLDKQACEFAYRDSVFKHSLKDRFIITELNLKLPKNRPVNVQYQALLAFLADNQTPTPLEVAEAVIAIRQSKLPDPTQLPNAGSFFKNPVISESKLAKLKQQYPDIVSYSLPEGKAKLAAGWLIDQLGWKGRMINQVAMHKQQALVLTNHGASGAEILAYAKAIQDDVFIHYGVTLEVEPRVY